MNVCEHRWYTPYALAGHSEMVTAGHVCIIGAGHKESHQCHCGVRFLDVPGMTVERKPDGTLKALGLPNPPFICGWKPTGLQPNEIRAALDGCPMCGHAVLAHMGEEQCVVCLLVRMTTPEWLRHQARIHGGRWPY